MVTRTKAVLALTLIVAVVAPTADAQYAYPPGYGAWGWPGWGGASTVGGDVAQGMGVFAAGQGAYNLQTAQAASINADTLMRWNEYLYQSQQVRNKNYYALLARRQKDVNTSRDKIYKRLRDSPNATDIARGDALNVAFDELNDPKVYSRALKGATAKVPGALIRNIPFQYASAAITTSVDQLTKEGVPAPLKAETFTEEREGLKKVSADLRKQDEETGKLDSATLEKARALLASMKKKVEATYAKGSRERSQSERWIKAAYGLSRMLETPAINTLLAGVEKRPDTTLADLLRFMKSFNLRFGVASTTRQRQAYNELYPLLDALRDQVRGPLPPRGPDELPALPPDKGPLEFFSAMDLDSLSKKLPPLPPAPRGLPLPPGLPVPPGAPQPK